MSDRSLRRQLLQWLLVPLLGLIAVDSTILYRIAMHFQNNAFDHALYDSAFDIAQLISESKNPAKFIQLSPDLRRMFLSDQYDQMYYSIVDENGQFIGGDKNLPAVSADQSSEKPAFFSSGYVNGKKVRLVVTSTVVKTGLGPHRLTIQVAETLTKRQQLAKKILLGIVIPQLLLVLAAVGIVWFGIGRGLRPLWELHAAVARRSHRDLSPVLLPNIPDEVQALVNSVNHFMGKLQNVLESQNRFIADAAHQLRTPLAGMLAQLELAQNETDPQERQAGMKRVERSMEQLAHMVNQLLVLARNQPEVIHSIRTVKLDLCLLAQNVATDMVPAAIQQDIDLGFEGSQEAVWIEGDPTRLSDLIANLIDNAIRYTGRDGKVSVSVAHEGNHAILKVEDNGPGIPAEAREIVFERFHRLTDSTQEGSGLGLAIVMEIAQIHHATVSVEETQSGQGTTFRVVFDALQETGKPLPAMMPA